MVAERRSTKVSALRRAMASSRRGSPRQPTLAEEIDELEKAEKVTAALQAQVEQHGMHTASKPQEQGGVTHTPKMSPKIGKTPSPVRVDKDGKTWTLEDDDEGQEEQEENENGSEQGVPARGSTDPRACAGSVDAEGPTDKTPGRKPMDDIVKDWLYPSGHKEDTPQMRSPVDASEGSD